MEFETLIRERFSVRNFQPEHLPQAVMGYPGPEAKPLPMHFAARPMEETVVYDSF